MNMNPYNGDACECEYGEVVVCDESNELVIHLEVGNSYTYCDSSDTFDPCYFNAKLDRDNAQALAMLKEFVRRIFGKGRIFNAEYERLLLEFGSIC